VGVGTGTSLIVKRPGILGSTTIARILSLIIILYYTITQILLKNKIHHFSFLANLFGIPSQPPGMVVLDFSPHQAQQ
jgi:hypothetical protein